MYFNWKRVLAVLLAMVMVVGTVPVTAFHAHAAETDQPEAQVITPNNVQPDAPEGYWYELDSTDGPNSAGYSAVCDKWNHTHGDSCYRKNCDHEDGHLSTCYASSTTYTLCPGTNDGSHTHTGTANLTDVVTIKGNDVQWITTHPAYTAIYNIYKAAYDAAYNSTRIGKELAGKIAGVAALVGKTVCYTTTQGEQPTCGHVCSEVGGTCYTKICLYNYEHTHEETDNIETSCYRYVWKLYKDDNGNQIGDGYTNGDRSDPFYTITYKGFGDVVLKEYQAVSSVATPAYDGATPTRDFYTFAGWDTAIAGTVSGNVTYTATWSPVADEDSDGIADEEDDFVITWDNAEGTWADGAEDTVKTQTENYGTALTAPEVVAPVDYFFAGWTPAVDKVTRTVTYVAQYTMETIYTVTYKVDGATYVINGVEQKFEVNVSDNEVVPAVPTPAKKDWKFTGWTNASQIGQVPESDLILEATWVADKNNNGKADSEETVTVTVAITGEGTATLHTNGNDEHIIITPNGNGSYSIVYDSVNNHDTIYVGTTPAAGGTTYEAYYLGRIVVNDAPVTETFTAADATVNVTFVKEVFELIEPEGGWKIKINGFSNETKAVDLKKLVLDALLGEGTYNASHYKVEMLTSYTFLGRPLGERYYNIEGESGNLPLIGDYEIPASWFVTQLTVDGITQNDFKITKLAASNASKQDLYIEKVMIIADEQRETTDNITLSVTDYTENTLADVITAIKGNVLVNGVAVNVTVTLTPETALTTTKQTYTATVVAPGTADYAESTAQFTITADIETYTVTWDPNNGETIKEQKNQPYGATITAPADPSKEGYTFIGWGEVAATVTGNATYTAQWEINSYTVTWQINGVTYGDSSTFEYGATVTAPQYSVPAGYNFSGWSVPTTMPAENLVLNATKTPINYDVKWVYQTANGSDTITVSRPYGSNIEQPVIPVTYKSGNVTYTFAGWTGLADGATVPVGGITYTASYTTKTAWIVEFNTDGGSTVTSQTIIVEDGDKVTEPANPTKDGYRFDGWYKDENCTTAYTFGATPSENQTVYAKWVKQVTVSFKGAEITSQTFDINEKATKPVDPDKEYAIFGDWYTDDKFENKFDFNTPVTSDLILHAKWIDDKNDNNKLDNSELVIVTVNIDGNGTVTLTGATDKVLVTNAGNNKWSVLYDSSVNGCSIVNVTVTPAETGIDDVKNYVDSAVATWDVTSSAEISVVFKQHSIDDKGNKNMAVNGHADEKVASVTKKAVLEAILGKTLTDAQIKQYTVKMYVNLGTYPLIGTLEGYFNIWDLSKYYEYGAEVESAIKSALVKAIDVGGTESFEVTWLAHDKYPEVTETFTVSLQESRKPTSVRHNGDTYTSGALSDTLLAEIKADLSANTTISTVIWGDNSHVDWENSKGQTVKVNLVVTVTETTEYYGTTHNVQVSVAVPYTEASVTIDETANLIYNTGMTDTDKAALVLQAVNPVYTPAMPTGFSATVWYLASEARTVPYTINIKDLNLGLAGNFLPDSFTVQIPVEEMWLNIGDDLTIPEAPSNELIKKILLEDLIPNYAADYVAGNLSEAQLKQILADVMVTYPEIAEYYKYLGAHKFGDYKDENGKLVEKVYITVPDYGYGTAKSNTCVLTLDDTRAESEIKLNEGVTVTYGSYTEESLLNLLLDGVYAGGVKVEGAKVEFATDVVGLSASEGTEVTVKFAGDKNNKPSTATATIVINKAIVDVTVDNQIVKWGTEYNKLPVSTNPAGVDTIQFIVGLDVSDVNIDGGFKGVLGSVQLLLPEELQDMLVMVDDLIGDRLGKDISFADGASLKLSELQSAVDALDDLLAGSEYEEYFRVLLNMLQSLPTETADVEVIVGGVLPSNVGVYLIGAVSADANYDTNFGVGILAVYPDGIKADIAWNQNDDNYIITNTLLTNGLFDTAAHATSVGEGGNLADATAQIAEIFLGVNIDGKITIETDPSKLNVGAYVEVAMIANWGNQMYYSMPIARPIVVIAETLDVDFVDQTGKVNNDRHYEFFNVPQNGMEGNLLVTYKQDGEGYKAGDAVTDYSVKYYYVGVQTNGKPYASTTAPTHAGAYTITAVITIRDNTGYITHAGQGIGALVIEPSKSTIDVENEAIPYDGNEHTINGFVDANSVNVPGLKPDTTIISAGIHADLDANTGLNAIKGSVNVDMPAWLDSVLNKLNILEAGYADGITADTFLSYVEKVKEAIVELGIEVEAFDKIVSLIEQLPGKTTLTFHDNKGYSEVGAYLVVGIVTDSDHYPSADAGIVVIYPNATKVELQFEEDWNGNNIFTWYALQNMNLEAKAYLNGAYHKAADQKVVNLYFGFTDSGEFMLEATTYGESIKDVQEFRNGLYTQLALVNDFGNVMYYAEPVSRSFVVVPTPAIIEFVDENGAVNADRHFIFNNKGHAMPVRITIAGEVVTDQSGLTVTYTGVQTNGKLYSSTDAPVHSGAYTVTATYTTRDEQGRLVTLGAAVGAMVIEPANSTMDVESMLHEYDGNTVSTDKLIHAGSVVNGLTPDKTVITTIISTDGTFSENLLSAITSEVNVDFPKWVDELLAQYAPSIYTEKMTAGEFAEKVMAKLNAAVDKAEALAQEYDIPADKLINALNNALVEVEEIVNQLPTDTVLTFKNQSEVAPKEVGTYLMIGIVTDSDHYPSADVGVLVIYPNVTKAKLDWFYKDSNGIFTLPALAKIDLTARGYVDGAEDSATNAMIAYLTVGIDENGKLVVTTAPNNITSNGAYTEVAYIPTEIGAEMTVAAPIMRSFVVVPQTVTVEVTDTETTFGEAYEVPVTVMKQDGSVVNPENLTVTYINLGTGYYSTTAPTEVGSYTVIAKYEEFINGDRAFFGMEIGNVTILPGEADYSMSDKTTECGTENAVDSMITNNSNLPYAIYIVKNVAAGEVNVILPAGWEITFQVGDTVDSLITAIEKLPAAIENTKIVETLKSVLNSIDMQTLAVNGEQPSVYGEYDVTAIAFGNKNYDIAKVSAKLTIDHAEDANLDHNCDACGEFAYGTCEDADKDHDCDYGCDKVYGEHKDADKDHACDYGCSEVIGTCGDADKDHDCDYGCDKVYGEHKDADKDHACDYGCDETIGTCGDADKDHDCDYGCDKAYGEHKDADKDHACDYGCSEVIGTCEDADKDHDCDYGCDKVYGEHKDADKDHACDYGCDETIGTCGDADKDHDCDYGCDKVYGEHADGDDTNHTCDYCGDEVAGDICVDNNKDHKCDECGAVMGNNNTPVLGIPALSGENIYGFAVDYANKRLYIDTVKTGLSIEQFVKQLSVAVFNDTDNKADIVVTYQNKTLTGAELIRTEAQVSLTAENPDGKTSIVYDVVVIGDVNCNGEVDSGDAALIQRYFFKEVELTQLQADAADTNRSGEIESGDSVKNQVKYNDTENYQSNLHSYTEYTSNGDATCEEDGTMTIKCTANHNCSAKSVIVPEAGSAKGHKYVYKENAYVCDICGKKLVPNV